MTILETLMLALLAAIAAGAAVYFLRPKTRPAAPLAFVRQWRPLTPEQIVQAFAGWNESDPRWRAQWDLLSNELEGVLADIAQTKSTPEDLARWAGRLEMVVHWRAQLLALRRRDEG